MSTAEPKPGIGCDSLTWLANRSSVKLSVVGTFRSAIRERTIAERIVMHSRLIKSPDVLELRNAELEAGKIETGNDYIERGVSSSNILQITRIEHDGLFQRSTNGRRNSFE